MEVIKIKTAEITIPVNVPMFTDKKTGVKTMAIPFKFIGGEEGILSLTKLVKMGWLPSDDIISIVINFK